MPTLKLQVGRRSDSASPRRATAIFVIVFSAFMVAGRQVSGVHWATDIVGSVLLAGALYMLYRGAVEAYDARLAVFIATRQPYAGIICFALLVAKFLLLSGRDS